MLGVPDMLTGYALELADALNTPLLAEWPEGVAYSEADQAKAIAKKLIPVLHSEIKTAKVAYLFRENLNKSGAPALGTAQRASAKIVFLTRFDFILEFNWTLWRGLAAEQRIALVDHELCHCVQNEDGTGFAMRHHDVEEFGEIIQRWGLWKPDLKAFGLDVSRALQHELQLEAVGS